MVVWNKSGLKKLQIVTAGKGISPIDVDLEFNAIIMGVADHLYQTFDIKYADRIITKIKDNPKNVLMRKKKRNFFV